MVEGLLAWATRRRHVRAWDFDGDGSIVGMQVAAVSVGATSADVVAVEARRLASRPQSDASDHPGPRAPDALGCPRVVSLTERGLTDPAAVIAGLPPDNRALPSVAGYDELLTRRANRDL